MKTGPPRRLAAFRYAVSAAVVLCTLLWVFEPQPLWRLIDGVPQWIYYTAFAALAAVIFLASFIVRHPRAPSNNEFDAEKYSIANEPTTTAQVVAIAIPFWSIFIDRIVAPWLHTILPATAARSIYLLVAVPVGFLLTNLEKRKRGASATP